MNYMLNIKEAVELMLWVIFVISILLYLYYRFVYSRHCVKLSKKDSDSSIIPGPKEWEEQMIDLSLTHQNVLRMRYNFVLADRNKLVHKKLNKIRKTISGISSEIISLIPAARWLFDNYQMMYREIEKESIWDTSYEKLPILRTKQYRGYPRVYLVAKNMVEISRGHINEKNISTMLHAYQQKTPLTDEELRILPIVLGFCLLERITEVADRIIDIIKIKSKADQFVKEKISVNHSEEDISSLLCEIPVDCKDNDSFHSQVIYLLRNMSFSKMSILKYTDYHYSMDTRYRQPANVFSEEGKIESRLESNIQVLIGSLRAINEIDEQQFFERLSFVESILNNDPAGVYPKMDSSSRDMYRSIIIKASKRYKVKEENIAYNCLKLATEGRKDIANSTHVGYYLIGKGYIFLKNKIQDKNQPDNIENKKFRSHENKAKGIIYYLVIFGFSIMLCFGMSVLIRTSADITERYLYILFPIIAFPILLGIASSIANYMFTKCIQIRKIPALDYQNGIPDVARTFLIMPILISCESQCKDYLERLERHYLNNRQSNLYFALIIDFEDAKEKHIPKDDILKEILIKQIEQYNKRYPSTNQRFSLFIRDRRWNEVEHCFMGWERKRGKIEEFNKLLCGAPKSDTTFSTILCENRLLGTYKYVITLDADSDLIVDNAAKLTGIIDHPLNQPIIDTVTRKVKEGYVIIQPTVQNHIIDIQNTRFSNIFGDAGGVSPYSFIISDIYQDIFNEGIYLGKGIYDVQAFNQLLNGVIPENSVLSHDLLESCYARTGFSSAVKILDTFPNTVLSYVKREHRWIRGDWQLLPWLFKRNSFNRVCKWKIFDNLRRSLVPFSKLLFLILNFLLMPKIFYLGFILIFIPDLLNLTNLLYSVMYGKVRKPRLTILHKEVRKEVLKRLQRSILGLIFIPYMAYIAMSAILQTLYRMIISKKNLLRWKTSENVEKSVKNTKTGYFHQMWVSLIPAIFILVFIPLLELSMSAIVIYFVLAITWIFSFLIAYSIRVPQTRKKQKQDKVNKELLLETARRTWKFFKVFSFKDNGWLCPDNYQEIPQKKISNKTSPTNIGLQFLTILTARDLGFETLSETVQRVENLLQTVVKFPKWKGHLYNWYNIHTLDILDPAYISTVDSGNFFGHIITLKNGLLEQIDLPILSNTLIEEFKVLLQRTNNGSHLKNEYTNIGELETDLKDIKEKLIKNIEDLKVQNEAISMLNHILTEIQLFNLQCYSYSNCATLREVAHDGNRQAKDMILKIENIEDTINKLLKEVSFAFLFNNKRNLFYIGYHVASETMDTGCYDLIASEALLTSYLAIARGDVPEKHWNKLGRLLTMINGIPCFVSWSGTMFEYLMPKLVMKEYGGTVFANTSKAAILQQIKYAKQKEIPWGISESQYYRFDLDSNYQYKAFGVPKIRLKPSFNDSLVVTPYATMLALSYCEILAFANLQSLKDKGVFGEYGFYESIDFNKKAPDNMHEYLIVKSFMTHHQGMIMVSINNYLNQGIMRTRFHKEPIIKAKETLLEEKLDSNFISISKRGYTIKTRKIEDKDEELIVRYVYNTAPTIPVANYLCNNHYSIMITSDGDGFSKYMNRMIYRWRPDRYAPSGNYIYIKDVKENKVWSATFSPTKVEADSYQAIFTPHQAEFKRRDGSIFSHTEISIITFHELEIRKVNIKNNGKNNKIIQLTSYLEVVGDTYMAELSHPAFNKLFIESEFLNKESIFLSKRRNSNTIDQPYIMHMVKSENRFIKKVEYENDRLKFIGRNNSLQNPDAMQNEFLSNSAGFSKDPIMSIRVSVFVKAGETVSVSFITGVCKNREEAIKISEEFNAPYTIEVAFNQFRRQSEMELKYLEITKSQLNAYQDLISPIYYPTIYYRGSPERIKRNWKSQSFLWKFGVSGDVPILLLRVKSIDEVSIVKDVLKAYEYYRLNLMKVDLIILNESKYGYMDDLSNFLNEIISTLKIYDESNEKKSLFIINSHQLIPEELDLLYTVASIVFSEETGIYFRSVKETIGKKI